MFKKNDVVQLTNGESVKIIDLLGEGGQGSVYKVEYKSDIYAFKWYKPNVFSDINAFYSNLKNNIEKGSPSDMFIWPLYLSNIVDGSFGYVMRLCPKDYVEFPLILNARKRFSSFNAMVNAALNITTAFRLLHSKGFSYQDLNDGNFFIKTDTGDVLICDNDNVVGWGKQSGIAGKARYMAPEIARHLEKPNKYTDYFSLSVILFLILFMNHPLEGERAVKVICMRPEVELDLYGRNPLFIFDPKDDSNRPVRNVNNNVIKLWPIFPQFIRELFMKAFSRDAMLTSTKENYQKDKERIIRTRIMDMQWQHALVNLRSCIVNCSKCGKETIIDPQSDSKCIECGDVIKKPFMMSFLKDKYRIPIFPSVKIYKMHINSLSDDFETVCGEINRNPSSPGVWGIKNLDSRAWTVITTDKQDVKLDCNRSMAVLNIEKIMFDEDSEAVVIRE